MERDNAKAIKCYQEAAAAALGCVGAWGNLVTFLCWCMVFFILSCPMLGELRCKVNIKVQNVMRPASLKLAIGWLYCAWGGLSLCIALAFFLIVGIVEKGMEFQYSPRLQICLWGLILALVFLLLLGDYIMLRGKKNGSSDTNKSVSIAGAELEAIQNARNLNERIKAVRVQVFSALLFAGLSSGILEQHFSEISFSGLMMALGGGLSYLLTILVFFWIKCISIGGVKARVSFSLFSLVMATASAYTISSLCAYNGIVPSIVVFLVLLIPILLIWTPKANEWFRLSISVRKK